METTRIEEIARRPYEVGEEIEVGSVVVVVEEVNRAGRPTNVQTLGEAYPVHTSFGSAAAFRWWLAELAENGNGAV